jgi:hydrogenase-4 component B
LVASALLGAILAVLLTRSPGRCRTVAFSATAISAGFGILAAIDVFVEGPVQIMLPFNSPFGSFSIGVDLLSAFFLFMISLVSGAVAVYSIGYAKEYEGHYSPGLFGFLFNIFLLSMMLVVTAGNAVMFLIVWELMSVSSYLLVVYENRASGTLSSGLLYLVMTHIGTAFIAVSFVLLAFQSGSLDFSSFVGVGGSMSALLRAAAFGLLFVGFGMKAGIVPLHVWLPYAHPAAPSNVSALMSGVMVKTAIFMLVRTYFDFLGVTDVWWGLLALLVGSVSALLGVLYALMETDIKRVLAYSTVENVGIILLALGAAMVFQAYGLSDLAALALIATLFHSFNHAVFKGLLFMGAGSLLHATHTRDLEQMGGLARRMKYTGMMFFVGVLAIAAIPPFNGFVSEWLIFQSLLLSFSVNAVTINLLMAIAVGILALTGALAAACFVRVFGIAFLGRPRSAAAEQAKDVPRSMLAGMGIMALVCLLAGALSILVIPQIDRVTETLLHVSVAGRMVNGLVLSTPSASFSSFSPYLLALLVLVLIPLCWIILRVVGGKREARIASTWDCGTPLTARNQYSATGFSQPLGRVFSYLYRSRTEVKEEGTASPYVKRSISYSTAITPLFERYMYAPVQKVVLGVAGRVGIIQTGSIQAYLAYIFAMLVFLLIVFR